MLYIIIQLNSSQIITIIYHHIKKYYKKKYKDIRNCKLYNFKKKILIYELYNLINIL